MKYVGESIWGVGFIFKILKGEKSVWGGEDEKQVKKDDKIFLKTGFGTVFSVA